MLLLSADMIRNWDRFTIEQEPVASIDLMERAAEACVRAIAARWAPETPVKVFCGKGNNGGDGLAIARLLTRLGFGVNVYVLEFGRMGSTDFQTNLQRLHEYPVPIHYLQSPEHLPSIDGDELVIDALFGTGLRGELQDLAALLVRHLNEAPAFRLSIDLPSGLLADTPTRSADVLRADRTLTFQAYKLALLVQENAGFIGEVTVLDIGLHPGFLPALDLRQHLIDEAFARTCYRPRNRFAHKGDFGHALLVAGSRGKTGAAVLAASACLRSGVGLLTCLAPGCSLSILQTSVPEAMVETRGDDYLRGTYEDQRPYACIGLGPGIGTEPETAAFLRSLVQQVKVQMVIDADALNLLAIDPELFDLLPAGSILTPHPREFDRLFGRHVSSFARFETAAQQAAMRNIIILLKGHHTLVATPGGHRYFNTTGNAGMAKGGSGDVLTGILTALLAQGYDPVTAAIFGVYLHGLAGDLAAERLGMEAMTAMDLVTALSPAFLRLSARIS